LPEHGMVGWVVLFGIVGVNAVGVVGRYHK
jgi:hypothetical protein